MASAPRCRCADLLSLFNSSRKDPPTPSSPTEKVKNAEFITIFVLFDLFITVWKRGKDCPVGQHAVAHILSAGGNCSIMTYQGIKLLLHHSLQFLCPAPGEFYTISCFERVTVAMNRSISKHRKWLARQKQWLTEMIFSEVRICSETFTTCTDRKFYCAHDRQFIRTPDDGARVARPYVQKAVLPRKRHLSPRLGQRSSP